MNTMQEQLSMISKEIFKSYNMDNNIKNIDNKISKNIIISNNIENKINEIRNKEIVHRNTNESVAMSKINNKKSKEIKRGEIWMVDLGDNGNSIQSGLHPFLVTSNDLNNQYSPNITGCSGTSKVKSRLPVHVEIEGYGLKVKTIILCETLCPIDKSKFKYKMGEVDESIMLKVQKAINIQNGDLKPKSALERLDKNVQEMINEKLEDIRSIERTICTIVNNDEYLERNLYGQRECYLASLERICKKHNLNYHDYYTMYKREKEEERIVV